MKYFLIIGFIFSLFGLSAQSLDFLDTDFSRADSIALSNSNLKLTNPEKLSEILTKDLNSELEKFRVIFRWITNNISYDTRMYALLKRKENKLKYDRKKLLEWRKKFKKKIYKRTLRRKIAICEGYSRVLETMCRHVGISCETISGYPRNENSRIGLGKPDHAWNAVKINNKWYLADATWASGYVNSSGHYFTRRFNKIYFLTDPSYFIADHYPIDKSWILLLNKPSLNEFLCSPIKLEGFYKKKLVHFSPKEGIIKINRDSTFSFSFTSNASKISTVSTELISKSVEYSNNHYQLSQSNEGYYVFKHKFVEKGSFKFYIYIDSKATFVYDVLVK